MNSVPEQPSPQQPSLAELRRRYPAWKIGPEPGLRIYSAELKAADGSVRYLAGYDLGELAARLEVAVKTDVKTDVTP